MHCHGSAVDMQLAHHGRTACQLRLALACQARHSSQTQQADQDVLPGVLIRQEGLPAPIGCVVPPDQLHLRWLDLANACWFG